MNLIKKGRMIKNLSFCLFCKLDEVEKKNQKPTEERWNFL